MAGRADAARRVLGSWVVSEELLHRISEPVSRRLGRQRVGHHRLERVDLFIGCISVEQGERRVSASLRRAVRPHLEPLTGKESEQAAFADAVRLHDLDVGAKDELGLRQDLLEVLSFEQQGVRHVLAPE